MEYVEKLVTLFRANYNPEVAESMAAYLKNRFQCLGLKRPQRNILQRTFFKENGVPEVDDMEIVTRNLWKFPEREIHYFTIDLLVKMQNKLPDYFIITFEDIIVSNSWWDSVDIIATKLVGNHFKKFPELRDKFINRWRISDDFWLRRTCLLFQLHYKKDTDTKLLFKLIEENLGSNEFFINKAIGWALREYSKTNADWVIDFVSKAELSNLSKREALKWLKNSVQQTS